MRPSEALRLKCAIWKTGPFQAYNVVWHLNDNHLWTDDQIADWLSGLGL